MVFIIGILILSSFTFESENPDLRVKESEFHGQSPVIPQKNSTYCTDTFSVIQNPVTNSPCIENDTSDGVACDIIYFKSGKMEYCKIIESNPSEVIYKMCDYLDGPIIRVNKSDLFKIRYANGREDIVSASSNKGVKNAYFKARKEGFASASMIISFISLGALLFFGHFAIALLLSILALLFGIIALVKINKSNDQLRGKGAAITGVIISSIVLLLSLLILLR